MSAITKLLNVKVEERSDAIRLQFVFNDNKWHALEMYKPVDVEELGKQLIKSDVDNIKFKNNNKIIVK